MHNLHLVVVRAENGENACEQVETFIMNWGDENNWRTICGAVSENNEVYTTNQGRYQPDEDSNTIKKINKMVKVWLEGDYFENTKKLLAKGKKIENFNTNELYSLEKYANELYSLEKYAKFLYEVKSIKLTKKFHRKNGEKVSNQFNVLKDEFYSYTYDECGVTQTTANEGKLWVVFVDMHS